jgi:hypothetical protein
MRRKQSHKTPLVDHRDPGGLWVISCGSGTREDAFLGNGSSDDAPPREGWRKFSKSVIYRVAANPCD